MTRLRADQRLHGLLDQVLAACTSTWIVTSSGMWFSSMSRRLKSNSVFDADGKTDLDFLEPALHQRLEKLEFLRDVHRHGERLVAIAEIDAAPDGRAVQRAARPLPVRQFDGRERAILGIRILQHDF